MEQKYLFKLKKKRVPDLTQKTDKEEQYGGIRLIYTIYRIYFITLFGREITWYKRKLGIKTFLRPYKKFWDKRKYRLPYVYWGKKSHPLTRHWITISNDYVINGTRRIVPELSLIHQHVKLFGHTIVSKSITDKLFGCVEKFIIKTIN